MLCFPDRQWQQLPNVWNTDWIISFKSITIHYNSSMSAWIPSLMIGLHRPAFSHKWWKRGTDCTAEIEYTFVPTQTVDLHSKTIHSAIIYSMCAICTGSKPVENAAVYVRIGLQFKVQAVLKSHVNMPIWTTEQYPFILPSLFPFLCPYRLVLPYLSFQFVSHCI